METLTTSQSRLSEIIDASLVSPRIEANFIKLVKDPKRSKVLFLDYDGTLVGFKNNPEDARPDEDLLLLLNSLAFIEHLEVFVISGRDKNTLNKWLGHLPIHLISDHGVFYKPKNEDWTSFENLKTDWMEKLLPVLEKFVDRTPGSFIEEKEFSIAWHYRKVDIELAQKRLVELKTVLNSFISNTDLTMLDGKKVLEIKSSKVSKGRASATIQSTFKFDEVFCFGDDWTDEFMFEDLQASAHSIKVGLQKTKARYYLQNPEKIRELLAKFVG